MENRYVFISCRRRTVRPLRFPENCDSRPRVEVKKHKKKKKNALFMSRLFCPSLPTQAPLANRGQNGLQQTSIGLYIHIYTRKILIQFLVVIAFEQIWWALEIDARRAHPSLLLIYIYKCTHILWRVYSATKKQILVRTPSRRFSYVSEKKNNPKEKQIRRTSLHHHTSPP